LLPASERGNWRNYLELCLQMARGVRRLHLAGLAHSDLSCNNILIDPPNGRAVIIDVDSLVVPGLFPPDVAGTPGYIAPEVIATLHLDLNDQTRKLPCNYTDMHALAVLIYEYLLRRHPLKGPKVHHMDPTEDDRLSFGEKALFVEHPTDSANRASGMTVTLDHLGPHIKAVFLKAFVDGLHDPTRRPTASEWEGALARTLDFLVPCANPKCEDAWFVHLEGQPPRCPWCNTLVKQPFPVFDFLYAPKPGQYRPENHRLIGYHDRPLFKWHIQTHFKNVETVDAEPQAKVMLHQGQWILLNLNLISLISSSGNPVSAGQACLLKEGDEILLSKDERGRLASIRMVG
jgi:serine/threonine protein kinase